MNAPICLHMIRQVAARIQWQRPRVLDDFEVRPLASFVEISDAAFELGDFERVVHPHQPGIRRIGQADRREGGVEAFAVAGVVERYHRARGMTAGEAIDPRDAGVHLFDAPRTA